MKISWVLALLILSAMILSACGSDTTSINEESENTASTNETEEQTAETEEAGTEEETEVVNEDVQEDDSLKATNTYTNKELGVTGEIGSMQYEI